MRDMIRGIDHLVIACADPDAAAAELTDALGLAVTGGGRHESGGTRNRIAWLGDGNYIELIGVDDRDAALGSPVGAAAVRALDTSGGGLATLALTVDDLNVTALGLRASGSSLSDPLHGSRMREDGELVEWWVSVPAGELGPDSVPFLIQHAMVGTEWGHMALAERAAFVHPIGSPVLLVRVDLATDDPPSLAARYHEELGLDVWAVSDLAVCTIGPHVIRLVPAREMDAPAVVTIGAQVDGPRTVDALGMRFDVERVEVLTPVTPGG
jgi:hypothetical protein